MAIPLRGIDSLLHCLNLSWPNISNKSLLNLLPSMERKPASAAWQVSEIPSIVPALSPPFSSVVSSTGLTVPHERGVTNVLVTMNSGSWISGPPMVTRPGVVVSSLIIIKFSLFVMVHSCSALSFPRLPDFQPMQSMCQKSSCNVIREFQDCHPSPMKEWQYIFEWCVTRKETCNWCHSLEPAALDLLGGSGNLFGKWCWRSLGELLLLQHKSKHCFNYSVFLAPCHSALT